MFVKRVNVQRTWTVTAGDNESVRQITVQSAVSLKRSGTIVIQTAFFI